jgi:hypothetical protein
MKDETIAALFCLGLAIVILLTVSILPGCQSAPPSPDVTFYAGDSRTSSVVRSQVPSSTISCSDPKFDDYVCVSNSDMLKITSIMGGQCKQW